MNLVLFLLSFYTYHMHRLHIAIEITLLFIIPIIWFMLGLSPVESRLIVFEIFIGLILVLAISRRMSFRDMGFRLDNFLVSLKLMLPGIVIGLAAVIILYKLKLSSGWFFNGWYKNIFFFYYAILGVFSQEFAFRGFLLSKLKEITSEPIFIILINATLFAALHALHQSWSVAGGAFLLGAYLTWAYLKQPNIIAAWLMHTIVGGAAIILGFI